MLLLPNRTKHSKVQKGKRKNYGVANTGCTLAFGTYGLKALEYERLQSKQIEASRRCIARSMKRAGKIWIRVFPQIPVTDKPAEVRMGKGKGAVAYWMCRVKPGLMIFEIDGVDEKTAFEALGKAANKLPFKTKIVKYI